MILRRPKSIRDELIVEMFNAGGSYQGIADALSEHWPAVTRNVVAGTISRHRHLITRTKGLNAQTGRVAKIGIRKKKRPALPPRPETTLTITDLRPNTCRWPYGEGKDTTFCGASCSPHVPYCDEHMAVAFQNNSTWTDRDRTFMSSQLTGSFR